MHFDPPLQSASIFALATEGARFIEAHVVWEKINILTAAAAELLLLGNDGPQRLNKSYNDMHNQHYPCRCSSQD